LRGIVAKSLKRLRRAAYFSLFLLIPPYFSLSRLISSYSTLFALKRLDGMGEIQEHYTVRPAQRQNQMGFIVRARE
jgi:hypothetical protein